MPKPGAKTQVSTPRLLYSDRYFQSCPILGWLPGDFSTTDEQWEVAERAHL